MTAPIEHSHAKGKREMKNDVVNTNAQYDDGFDVAEPVTGGLVKGSLLKFKDDAFLINGSDHLPDDVTNFTVVGMLTMWVRWQDEKPTHRITQRGEVHPRRDELPDQDPAAWPKGKDGTKTDPWQDGRHVTLIHDASAQTFTFTTASVGGRIAVAELKDAIALRRRVRPGCCPIVELATKTMKTRFGDRLRPFFKIVGWHEGEVQPAVMAPIPPTPREAAKALASVSAEISSAEMLNDGIPF
jgi:hypothetical protein